MQASSKDLTIIIPVYNSMDLFPRCVESILNQTIDLLRVEVLLVDDGSTDGSGELCDKYKKEYPDLFRVIHQANSGGPAQPRNRGIAAAQGEYIFFCDNDDYFGLEAFERMLNHAFEWNSDVLLCKMGETGRKNYPRAMFKESSPRVDLYTSYVVYTLGPWKLFRRSLLLDNDILFPEDCSLDDLVFTLKAYLLAQTISVASDYDYYYWTIQSDRSNLSATGGSGLSSWNKIEGRLLSTKKMLCLIKDYADEKRALPLYIKTIGDSTLKTLELIAKDSDGEKKYEEVRSLLSPYITEEFLERIPFARKIAYSCLRDKGDYEGFRGSIQAGKRGIVGFYYFEGIYVCKEAFENKDRCEICQRFVEQDVIRVRANIGKPEADLSDVEKAELEWLKKEDMRKKLDSNILGRLGLRVIGSPKCRRIIKRVKRKDSISK